MLISTEELNRILNSNNNENYWFKELGKLTHKPRSKSGTQFSYNYVQIGKNKWNRFSSKLYDLFCKSGKPKKNLNFLIEGDPRDIAQAILTAIMIHFETTIAIATPLTGLVLSKGLIYLCKATHQTTVKKKIALKETKNVEKR